MTLKPRKLWNAARTYLPIRSAWKIARTLVAQASAERDAGQFQTATALYEQALRLAPGAARFVIQFGHCRKEAGDYDGAQALYLRALRELPDDPDLALQLGHLYKLAGRHDDAEREYRRADTLRPGWLEAEQQLAALGLVSNPGLSDASGLDKTDMLAFELLPYSAPPAPTEREGFHVLRLGANFSWTGDGYRRVLRGVEAVRGYIIAPTPVEDLTILIDGQATCRTSLKPIESEGVGQLKHVFNVWHDFTSLGKGPHEIVLRAGRFRHGVQLHVIEPHDDRNASVSDAVIGDIPGGLPLDEAINALSSVIRSSRRSILPGPITTILVQRVDQLGDLACSVPALRRLRESFPNARIVGLLTTANEALARALGLFDDIVVADFPADPISGRRTMSRQAQEALRRMLHRFDFDLALDFGETSISRPLLRLSGARFLYGFKSREFPWLDGGVELTTRDPANRGEIASHGSRIVALVESLAAMISAKHDVLRSPTRLPTSLARFSLGERRYVVLHGGARLAYSRWPGFDALAALLLSETALAVVMMGAEEPTKLSPSSRLIVVSGDLPFEEFDALISGAVAFVGNDSGPKHLAALRGVPVVSLHMARLNWNEWGQTGEGAIISRHVPCAGCGIGRDGAECGKDFACIRNISAPEVMSALLGIVDKA